MMRWSIPVIALLSGCPATDQYVVGGETLWEHFPFDGTRTWSYISSDLELTYKLEQSMRPEGVDEETFPGFRVYYVDTITDCVAAGSTCVEGELVRTLAWSSDVANGTLIHQFVVGSAEITFDPPLIVAPPETKVGAVTPTETDGLSWTSTLVGYETCEGIVKMQGEDFKAPNCAAHLTLSDGDSDEGTNYGLAGDYWAAKGLGIVGIRLEGDADATWGLSKLDCVPDDDCDGTW